MIKKIEGIIKYVTFSILFVIAHTVAYILAGMIAVNYSSLQCNRLHCWEWGFLRVYGRWPFSIFHICLSKIINELLIACPQRIIEIGNEAWCSQNCSHHDPLCFHKSHNDTSFDIMAYGLLACWKISWFLYVTAFQQWLLLNYIVLFLCSWINEWSLNTILWSVVVICS